MFRDLRYGLRMLLKNPGLTLTAVLTLALGVGANTAIFSLVRGVLLRPIPFQEPERLIGIRESKTGEGHSNPLAWRSFFAFRDQAQTLEAVAAYLNWNPDVERDEGTVRVIGAQVSTSYFKVMGVSPLLGRDFTPDDGKYNAPPVVMLSYELWQQMYGGDADVVDQSLRIDGRSYAIIGVMPPDGSSGLGGVLSSPCPNPRTTRTISTWPEARPDSAKPSPSTAASTAGISPAEPASGSNSSTRLW